MERVENSQSEFPTLSTGLGNPAKDGRIPTHYKRTPLFKVGVGMVYR
jgi:hypothetical protein